MHGTCIPEDVTVSRLGIGAAPCPAHHRGDRGRRRSGGVAVFLGLVRNHNAGRTVLHLGTKPATARACARAHCGRSVDRWPEVRMGLHHRTGRLEIGEASVVIVTASAHRADAFASCRYVIERVKQIAPIWKREFFEGGDVWIEGATADPDDQQARAEAERVACA
jgi:molybdopterin synthase catalytic subunit